MGFFLSFFFTDDFSLEPYFFQTMTPAQLSAGRPPVSSPPFVRAHFPNGGEHYEKKINFPKNLMALFWVEKLITV